MSYERDGDKALGKELKVYECKPRNEIQELEAENLKLMAVLSDISNMCIGEIAMNYKLDAQSIGEDIYRATGKTNAELNNYISGLNNS